MSKYRFLYAYWFIPAYLFFLVFQQAMVHKGSIDTYENGESYLAEITGFEIKQIAAQSNGYVEIKFTVDGEVIERRLSLSIQMAQELMESSSVPLRYQEGAYPDIVLFPTYEIQKSTSLFNMSVAAVGVIITFIAGIILNRFIKRRSADEHADEFNIERVDQ